MTSEQQQGGTSWQYPKLVPADVNVKQNGVFWSKAYITASSEFLEKDFPVIYA